MPVYLHTSFENEKVGIISKTFRGKPTLRFLSSLFLCKKKVHILLKREERWERQLSELGVTVLQYRDTLGDALWHWVLVLSGTENVLARIQSAEEEDTQIYSQLMAEAPSKTDRAEIASVLHDEQVHQSATGKINLGVAFGSVIG